MAETKTKPDSISVADFLAQVGAERQTESHRLIDFFQEVTGFSPIIWGGSMIGFGRYAYRYPSGHAGESFATGFAPRKAELVLYGLAQDAGLLAQLGKHRLGATCVYVKRLNGVNEAALRDMIRLGVAQLAKDWAILPA